MGWVCLDCGNKELFEEINEFVTKVYQDKQTTRVLFTSDKPLGTGAFETKCLKCGSYHVKWNEVENESNVEEKKLLDYLKTSFKCVGGCARCCKYFTVYVTEEDIKKIEKYTGLERKVFTNGNFIKFVDGHCYFLRGDKCIIYDARPEICRNYPFVPGKPLRTETFFFCKGLKPLLKKYTDFNIKKLHS